MCLTATICVFSDLSLQLCTPLWVGILCTFDLCQDAGQSLDFNASYVQNSTSFGIGPDIIEFQI